MDDILFLKDAKSGSAKLIITNSNRPDSVIRSLNFDTIRGIAPQFANAFVNNKPDRHILKLNDVPTSAAICLIRYVYLGDYTMCDALYEKPCSLLLHFQVFRLAEIYDIARLQEMAYSHVLRETELTLSTGKAVIDLCHAIRFLYLELRTHEKLREVVAHYCLSCYDYHGLRHHESFRQTVYECSLFHQDLSKANLRADFADTGATDVFAMAVCTHAAHRSKEQYVQIAADFMCRYHTLEYSQDAAAEKSRSVWREPSLEASFVFIDHPKRSLETDFATETQAQDETDSQRTQRLENDQDCLEQDARESLEGPSDDEEYARMIAATGTSVCTLSPATIVPRDPEPSTISPSAPVDLPRGPLQVSSQVSDRSLGSKKPTILSPTNSKSEVSAQPNDSDEDDGDGWKSLIPSTATQHPQSNDLEVPDHTLADMTRQLRVTNPDSPDDYEWVD
ncbi:MAG: hypothetical protein M1828_001874 [Chrysothrix sp. TS-e1954]|nr:MAG: hypothetical protein M1828_001874 [Chrysothrix sp. TS-e1954]